MVISSDMSAVTFVTHNNHQLNTVISISDLYSGGSEFHSQLKGQLS